MKEKIETILGSSPTWMVIHVEEERMVGVVPTVEEALEMSAQMGDDYPDETYRPGYWDGRDAFLLVMV